MNDRAILLGHFRRSQNSLSTAMLRSGRMGSQKLTSCFLNGGKRIQHDKKNGFENSNKHVYWEGIGQLCYPISKRMLALTFYDISSLLLHRMLVNIFELLCILNYSKLTSIQIEGYFTRQLQLQNKINIKIGIIIYITI